MTRLIPVPRAVLGLSFSLLVVPGVPLPAAFAQEGTHPAGRHADVLDSRIWIETEGEGEPLLLIPGGGGGSHDYYHPWFSDLADEFRVVYYDGFGRGRSERAESPDEYSFERDVEEVEALRRALGLGRVHVLGHSYGGFVAQAYALRYPEHVRSLVLANTFLSPGKDWQWSNDHVNGEVEVYLPELWERIESLRAEGHLASSPQLQEAYFGAFGTLLELFYFHDPRHAADIVLDENTFNAEEYYALAGPDADFVVGGDMAGLDFEDRLGDLALPILVLAGRSDGIVPPLLTRRFVGVAPDLEYVVFERSGHFPFIEEREATMEAIQAFLRRAGGE